MDPSFLWATTNTATPSIWRGDVEAFARTRIREEELHWQLAKSRLLLGIVAVTSAGLHDVVVVRTSSRLAKPSFNQTLFALSPWRICIFLIGICFIISTDDLRSIIFAKATIRFPPVPNIDS